MTSLGITAEMAKDLMITSGDASLLGVNWTLVRPIFPDKTRILYLLRRYPRKPIGGFRLRGLCWVQAFRYLGIDSIKATARQLNVECNDSSLALLPLGNLNEEEHHG